MSSEPKIIHERYRILSQLGQGGMGEIYEAFDQRLSSKVALKRSLINDEEFKTAFEREAKLLANLHHPALPRVIDHFIENNQQYLVMDFIPGDDLQKLLDKNVPFSLSDIIRWADELLAAIEYLHSFNPPIIHRDIKPANLKLTPNGNIVLLDFGLAKGSAGAMTITNSRSVWGHSANYASLEQIQGQETTPQSDLYSVAATLYHLITKHQPLDAQSRAFAIINKNQDLLIPLRNLCRACPPEVDGVIMQALSLRPIDRPASAAQIRSVLQRKFNSPASKQTNDFRPEIETRVVDRSVRSTQPPAFSLVEKMSESSSTFNRSKSASVEMDRSAYDLICPHCDKLQKFVFTMTSSYVNLTCPECSRAFVTRIVKVRSKNSRKFPKEGVRRFSIRVKDFQGNEDLIEFVIRDLTDHEFRSGDLIAFSYKEPPVPGREQINVIQNFTINRSLRISSGRYLGCSTLVLCFLLVSSSLVLIFLL